MSLGLFCGICVTMSNSHVATFFYNLWYHLYVHIYSVLGQKASTCICDQKTVTGIVRYVVTVGSYVEELYVP